MIQEYIRSKTHIWSNTTIRSESYRLQGLSSFLNGNAEELWVELKTKYKPYARLTAWTRVAAYYSWANPDKPNPYIVFRNKNAHLFKNNYLRSPIKLDYQEIVSRINNIADMDSRNLASQIIHSCERFFEAVQDQAQDKSINGKGNKRRVVFRPSKQTQHKVKYATFRRHLRQVGLKPHDLRKAGLTRLVELGANEFELCEIAGWSSIQTATSYIQASRSRIERLMASL